MGWWKITIEPEFNSGLPLGTGGLLNSIPGQSDPAALYNGDRPADLAAGLWPRCRGLLNVELFATLLASGPRHVPNLPPDLQAEAEEVRTLIIEAYEEAWDREPEPLEWLAIADFVCGGEADEAPPADPEPSQRDYEEAAGEGVSDLWENHFSSFMDPFRFREALITGHPCPPAPDDAVQLLTELRRRITQTYLLTWQREPSEADWRAFFQAAKLTFTLRDGTELPRAPFLQRTLELCHACDALTVRESVEWILDGFSDEGRPDLPLDPTDFERKRAELVEELTAGRNHPPAEEDWQALAQLVIDFVNDPRNHPDE